MQPQSVLTVRPSWGERLMGMEGLRGIAAATVLVGHVQSHLADGVDFPASVDTVLSLLLNGLTLFFALSGFLLFRPFAATIVSGRSKPDIGRFFRNRALRIFPAYVAILLLVSLVFGAAYTENVGRNAGVEGVGQTVGHMYDPLLLLTNLTMTHTLFPGTIKTGLGASWSLTVELLFYLVLPFVSWAAWRFARGIHKRAAVAAALFPAALLLVVGMAGRYVADAITPATTSSAQSFYYDWGGNWYAVFTRSFPAQADLFAFGMVAAVVIVLIEQRIIAGRGVIVARLGGVALVVLGVLGGRHSALFSDTWWALGCGALIFLVAAPTSSNEHNLVARGLEWLPFRYVGLVSYSMYLWHLPVLWLLDQADLTRGESRAGFVFNVLLVFAVTLAVSSITYFGVEKPALGLKARTGQRRRENRSSRQATVSAD